MEGRLVQPDPALPAVLVAAPPKPPGAYRASHAHVVPHRGGRHHQRAYLAHTYTGPSAIESAAEDVREEHDVAVAKTALTSNLLKTLGDKLPLDKIKKVAGLIAPLVADLKHRGGQTAKAVGYGLAKVGGDEVFVRFKRNAVDGVKDLGREGGKTLAVVMAEIIKQIGPALAVLVFQTVKKTITGARQPRRAELDMHRLGYALMMNHALNLAGNYLDGGTYTGALQTDLRAQRAAMGLASSGIDSGPADTAPEAPASGLRSAMAARRRAVASSAEREDAVVNVTVDVDGTTHVSRAVPLAATQDVKDEALRDLVEGMADGDDLIENVKRYVRVSGERVTIPPKMVANGPTMPELKQLVADRLAMLRADALLGRRSSESVEELTEEMLATLATPLGTPARQPAAMAPIGEAAATAVADELAKEIIKDASEEFLAGSDVDLLESKGDVESALRVLTRKPSLVTKEGGRVGRFLRRAAPALRQLIAQTGDTAKVAADKVGPLALVAGETASKQLLTVLKMVMNAAAYGGETLVKIIIDLLNDPEMRKLLKDIGSGTTDFVASEGAKLGGLALDKAFGEMERYADKTGGTMVSAYPGTMAARIAEIREHPLHGFVMDRNLHGYTWDRLLARDAGLPRHVLAALDGLSTLGLLQIMDAVNVLHVASLSSALPEMIAACGTAHAAMQLGGATALSLARAGPHPLRHAATAAVLQMYEDAVLSWWDRSVYAEDVRAAITAVEHAAAATAPRAWAGMPLNDDAMVQLRLLAVLDPMYQAMLLHRVSLVKRAHFAAGFIFTYATSGSSSFARHVAAMLNARVVGDLTMQDVLDRVVGSMAPALVINAEVQRLGKLTRFETVHGLPLRHGVHAMCEAF